MKKLVIFFCFWLSLTSTGSGAADAFTTKNLNLRTGPSIQYMLRGLIPAGKLVFVQTCKRNWCHIRYNTQIGWVSSRYLSFKDGNDLYQTYTTLSETKHNTYSHYPR
ncbi:SH3 domain-containing protein [Bartonella refiksaydamii]|uniref:SH3 domain-containing protein n=1 Tax=Bartonella refiksaydamii TaxID=2654951 RepID=UPI0012ECAE4C|nr:SH3 domain-containing protein [Bartonella refiksaydamii]